MLFENPVCSQARHTVSFLIPLSEDCPSHGLHFVLCTSLHFSNTNVSVRRPSCLRAIARLYLHFMPRWWDLHFLPRLCCQKGPTSLSSFLFCVSAFLSNCMHTIECFTFINAVVTKSVISFWLVHLTFFSILVLGTIAIDTSVVVPCFVIPGGRDSPTVFATVLTPALVVTSAPGKEDPASPEDPSTSDSVVVLCCAIQRPSSNNSFRNRCHVGAGCVV